MRETFFFFKVAIAKRVFFSLGCGLFKDLCGGGLVCLLFLSVLWFSRADE